MKVCVILSLPQTGLEVHLCAQEDTIIQNINPEYVPIQVGVKTKTTMLEELLPSIRQQI